ncbi:putative monooxygenase p33MONOX isoform X2 [Sardina pilchardus]|uniref:putative monooxygenase p33MONOX isoform X2 n=1 Tax=Sardina pilchardus TaxID=27697 RepID=UPI002E0E47CA
MGSRPGETPALESGFTAGLLGGTSSPIAMGRRIFNYDESLEAPMHSPPSDFTDGILWKNPVIPERKFKHLEELSNESGQSSAQTGILGVPAVKPTIPVTKAKATTVMSSLMIKLTQENIQRFEQQAGLTDSGYTPHKGLSAEDTHFFRKGENLPKLKMPAGDFKEDKLSTSAQSTPCGTPSCTPSVTPAVTPSVTPCASPYASPKVNRRSWFGLSPALSTPSAEASSTSTSSWDMGGNEGSGGGERWSFFGSSRPVVQKSSTDPGSDSTSPGGFTLQSYFGVQKSSTLEEMKTQVSLRVDDPTSFMPPKIEITDMEGRKALPRPHKLKPRDMNILTPSGF